MELQSFARKTVNLARKLKLDDIELLLTDSRVLTARIENRDVNLQLREGIFTAGIRVLKKGRLGYVPVTEPNVDLVRTGIEAALARAGRAPYDRFVTIPKPAEVKTQDRKVAALLGRPAKLRGLAQDVSGRAFKVKGVENVEGAVSVAVEERLVHTMHSRTPARCVRTAFSAFADVNSQDFDFVVGRKLPSLDRVAGLGSAVARSLPKRTTTPGKEKMKGRTVPVILHPGMVEGILRNLVAEHVYASTVQDGMSRYKPGDRVAADCITLHDDGRAPWSDSAFPVDDEGTPSRRTTVIREGVLESLLYDRASALKDGVESTGNGRRRPVLIEDSHEAPVRCSCNDLFLAPGTTPLAKMVRSIKRGLMVKYLLGFHTANRTTGDFTNTLYMGRVIRNGRAVALPEAGSWSVKGNALELLRNVSRVSRETMDVGSGRLPWVQVDLVVA